MEGPAAGRVAGAHGVRRGERGTENEGGGMHSHAGGGVGRSILRYSSTAVVQ